MYVLSIILRVFGAFAIIGFSILISMNGWGLQPVSWAWIIGGSALVLLGSVMLEIICKVLEKM